jgi:hypothetical protein
MKKIFFILLSVTVLFLTSCKSIENAKSLKNNKILIEKIDTIGYYYVIYGRDNKSKYKIISFKENSNSIHNLKIGKGYYLKIEPISLNKDTFSINYLDIQRCVKLYPNIEICTESTRELYISNNLIGLKYVKNPKQQYSNNVKNRILIQ